MARSRPKSVDGFILSNDQGNLFLSDFLRSPDFTLDALKEICRNIGIKGYSGADKQTLANIIAREHRYRPNLDGAILQGLLIPFKEWFAIRKGQMPRTFSPNDPRELLEQPGREKWYGPVFYPKDLCPWYIHPIFVPHWREQAVITDDDERDEKGLVRCRIRWLCFARIDSDYVSIHWRGLQHDPGDDVDDEGLGWRRQVETWKYIPGIFAELEDLGRRTLKDINLHRLVLDHFWEKFRYNKLDYRWSDLKLRSRSAGVKLNAKSSSEVAIQMGEKEIKGLLALARTLRRSIVDEIESLQKIVVANPDHYDDVLLQALIKDFGVLSYEFEVLTAQAGRLMRYNCYFGVQEDTKSDDDFPHVLIYKSFGDHIEQLRLILEHLRLTSDYNDQPEQGSLL